MATEEELKLKKLELEIELLKFQNSKTSFEAEKLQLENTKLLTERKMFSFHRIITLIPIFTTTISIALGVWGGIVTYNKYFDERQKEKEESIKKYGNNSLLSAVDTILKSGGNSIDAKTRAIIISNGSAAFPILIDLYTNENIDDNIKAHIPSLIKNIRCSSLDSIVFNNKFIKTIEYYKREFPDDPAYLKRLNKLSQEMKFN